MPKIKFEMCLNCEPQQAFNEIADMGFVKKINPQAGLDIEVLDKNERFVRYILKVNNVGNWESERMLIPENLSIVTQRRNPMVPFEHLIVLHIFQEYEDKTLFTYIEEFEMDKENKGKEKKVLQDIKRNITGNLKKISEYFNQNRL